MKRPAVGAGAVIRIRVSQEARAAALLRALRDDSRVKIGLTEGQKRALEAGGIHLAAPASDGRDPGEVRQLG